MTESKQWYTDPREKLREKRRRAFHNLMTASFISNDRTDALLDEFFESGIELREREKNNGK